MLWSLGEWRSASLGRDFCQKALILSMTKHGAEQEAAQEKKDDVERCGGAETGKG